MAQIKIKEPDGGRGKAKDIGLVKSQHASRHEYRVQDELDARLMAEDEEIDLWDPESEVIDDEADESSDLDSDVDMSDEDELPPEVDDLMDAPSARLDTASLLIVHEGQVYYQPPDWDLETSSTDRAKERSLRHDMLEQLASWLNENRKEFLLIPKTRKIDVHLKYSLGKADLNGLVPVFEDKLHIATGCDKIGEITAFSRHSQHAVLRWPDFELPVSELLSHRSRIAWVAAAVLALRAARPQISVDIFKTQIVPPKGKSAISGLRSRIKTAALKSVPHDYCAFACLKTKVSWKKVLEHYGHLILA